MGRDVFKGMSRSMCKNSVAVPKTAEAPYGCACKIGFWRIGRACSRRGCIFYKKRNEK